MDEKELWAGVPATADLYDEHGEDLKSCKSAAASVRWGRGIHGQIVTFPSFEENQVLEEILAEPGHCRVIVVDAG